MRTLRGTRHITHGTKTHWMVWLGSCAGCAIFSCASTFPLDLKLRARRMVGKVPGSQESQDLTRFRVYSTDIIASAIPVFNGLLGLVGALFGTTMSFNAEACVSVIRQQLLTSLRSARGWRSGRISAFAFPASLRRLLISTEFICPP